MGLIRIALAFAFTFFFILPACTGRDKGPAPVYDMKLSGRSSGAAYVDDGDTLFDIARRYGLTLEDIIRLNQLPGDLLQAGQRLVLPPPRSYAVRPGDSVNSIAGMFDIDPAALIRENNLSKPYVLKTGQVLRLPVGHSARVAVARPSKTAGLPRPPAKPAYTQKQTGEIASARKTKFILPVKGEVVSAYGPKAGGLYNDGINIAARPGTAVRAADAGIVVYAGNGLEGYGNLILIRHPDGYFTVYSHLAGMRVAKGMKVKKGQSIGTVGSSGSVSAPQLHFEIRRGTESLDPQVFL